MTGLHEIFVSPDGRTSWSGRLPEPNADHTDGPLPSIEAARDAIRGRRSGYASRWVNESASAIDGPITVWLRGGRYPVSKPITFTVQDATPVTYKAYPGETPIIDGGLAITDWQVTEHNGRTCWIADLPIALNGWQFRQLFVNGERRARPRLPKKGLLRMERVPGLKLPAGWAANHHTQFVCPADGAPDNWSNLQDVEVVYVHFWIEERSTIESYNTDERLITMHRPSRASMVGSHGSQLADYYYDNVFEALTEPGEWYLDRAAGRMYYLPLDGETPENTSVYAPRTLQLLELRGDIDRQQFVEHLRFEGLTFEHTDWRHPDVSDGAGQFIRPSGDDDTLESRRHYRGNLAAAAQAACDVPGVVFMEAARYCSLRDCTIRHIGWYGVEIADACRGIQVVGNIIADMGAGGVKLNGSSAEDPAERLTSHHRITDNHIHAGGRVFHSAVGVLAMNARCLVISHNHIHDLFYSGISCGWVWGYKASVSRDNRIEYNHIHDLGHGLLSDMGGIYTLGVQPGGMIRHNLIHDITKAHYGAWCIYPDEGSSHWVVENNVCYNTNAEIFHQHYGRENIVRNNIFAFADENLLALSVPNHDLKSVTFYRNVLITEDRPVLVARRHVLEPTPNLISDLNLIWDASGKEPRFGLRGSKEPITLAQWRKKGLDQHSIIADPECRNLKKRDLALKKTSPALKQLGFEPIDLSRVGPRPLDERD